MFPSWIYFTRPTKTWKNVSIALETCILFYNAGERTNIEVFIRGLIITWRRLMFYHLFKRTTKYKFVAVICFVSLNNKCIHFFLFFNCLIRQVRFTKLHSYKCISYYCSFKMGWIGGKTCGDYGYRTQQYYRHSDESDLRNNTKLVMGFIIVYGVKTYLIFIAFKLQVLYCQYFWSRKEHKVFNWKIKKNSCWTGCKVLGL